MPPAEVRELAELLRRVAMNGWAVAVDEAGTPRLTYPTPRVPLRPNPPAALPDTLTKRLTANRSRLTSLLTSRDPCPTCAADVDPMPLVAATDEGCGCPLSHCPFRGDLAKQPPKPKGDGRTSFRRVK